MKQNQNAESDVKEIRLEDICKPLTEDDIENMSEQIDKWKEKYKGQILLIEVPGTSVCPDFNGIFRIPTKAEVSELNRKTRENNTGIESDAEIARLCVLHPEPITFSMILSKNWGVASPIAQKLISECQVNAQAKIKKL